jgi:glutamate-ammonia-ligase adenylyltransferase
MTERLELSGLRALVGDPSDLLGALTVAARHSGHIARMVKRRSDVMEQLPSGPESPMSAALAHMQQAGTASSIDSSMRDMRLAKEAGQLVISAADLAGAWTSDRVTQELTHLADAAVRSALRVSVREGWAQGWFDEKRESDDMPGLFALAMGKMGAGELNYSSDIDLILLFDLDVLPMKGPRV